MSEQINALSKIKNFTEFLENGLKKKVLEYTLKPLTKPGDNYGGILQSVDVKTKGNNNSHEDETLHLVVKTPATNPFLVAIFKPELSFCKEAHFYSDIIPAFQQFQQLENVPEEERLDVFVQYIGSRISLVPNAKKADEDGVLLLENLTTLNYVNADRRMGLNEQETFTVLRALAKFHALGIAMRRLQPDLFYAKVGPYLQGVSQDVTDTDITVLNGVIDKLQFVDNLDDELRDTIKKKLILSDKFDKNLTKPADSPYTTVVHRDLWTNNIMFHMDKSTDKPIKMKIIDFQLYYYQTFVCDLSIFLFTSVCSSILKDHFKSFIEYYHSEFLKTMQFVNYPLENYTFEKMWHEIQDKSNKMLVRILFLVKNIMSDESSTLDGISAESIFEKERQNKAFVKHWKCILDIYKEHELL